MIGKGWRNRIEIRIEEKRDLRVRGYGFLGSVFLNFIKI